MQVQTPVRMTAPMKPSEAILPAPTPRMMRARTRTARTQDAASIEATSGNDGVAEFDALSYGVYLVVQIDASGVAEKYETMPPFLINVPQFTDDGVVYDVVATPKPELKPTTPSKSNPPKRNPQTGDSLDWNMVGACAAIGLLAMVVALYAARKRRERRE